MQSERRLVIAGLSRLSLRVAELLAEPGTDLVIVAWPGERSLAGMLPRGTRLVEGSPQREETLLRAGLAQADSLLVLSEDDLENLNMAVAANVVAPEVPVVLRAFDPELADQLEGLHVRRAFSVSELAAPAFVAAALADDVLETLRLGPEVVTLLSLMVSPGSPLQGQTTADVKHQFGCVVVARADPGSDWRPAGLGEILGGAGERILVGGPLLPALRMAKLNAGVKRERQRRRPLSPTRRRAAASLETLRPRQAATLLPVTAAILATFLVLSVVVFAVALDLGPIEAMYFAVSTAFGNATLDDSEDWLKLVGLASMFLGGALIGVVFSYFASVATAQRLEQRAGRRAREMSGHAVIAGLGTVGFRVDQVLHQLGIPTAVLDRDPDPRFAGVVGERTPVLTGDVRLPENLERAGVEYLAFRYTADRTLEVPEIDRWREHHIRVLAFRRGDGPVSPASELTEPLVPATRPSSRDPPRRSVPWSWVPELGPPPPRSRCSGTDPGTKGGRLGHPT